jgi:LysR family transcriptional regulator, transcriptional activator for dmlA
MFNFAAELGFFAVVARASTLTAAALQLDVSVAAVSKRLSQLERELGSVLLQRSARSLSLTEAGERLLAGATGVLQEIDQLRGAVSDPGAGPRGRLRINGTFGFGRKFLAPVVDAYLQRYPAVDVQLLLTDFPLNLNTRAIDLCIWLDPLPEARQIARTLAPCRRLAVAAPSYFSKHGKPLHPSELAQHRCLLLRQTDQTYATWRFTRGKTTESVRVRGPFASNDGEAVKQLCLSGQGIMLRSEWDVYQEVAQGTLVPVLTEYSTPSSDVVAWFLPGQERSGRVRSFLDLLADSLGKTPPWQAPSIALNL